MDISDQDYFNIGQASRITQIPAYTLRYWESEFKLLRPFRRSSRHRRYTRKDLDLILKIKELLYEKKLTLAGAKRTLLDENRNHEPTNPQEFLQEVKKEIKAIVQELSKV
ncbi:MAG: MerR family transcriptional regulator [Elusimicrobia bacterium]|nr:MerR family transcriptional regulator [Elusimicrobiota bacterium]